MSQNGRVMIILCVLFTLLLVMVFMTGNKRIIKDVGITVAAEVSKSITVQVAEAQPTRVVSLPHREHGFSSRYYWQKLGNWEDSPVMIKKK